MDKFQKHASLLRRVSAFVGSFLLISGLLGPYIISHGVVGHDGFGIYGPAGKVLLFSIIAFGLLARGRVYPRLSAWKLANLAWFGGAIIAATSAWIGVSHLISESGGAWALLVHAGIVLAILCSLLGSFGSGDTLRLERHYKRELSMAVGIGLAFWVLLLAVYSLWQPLAGLVLHSVKWLLALSGIHSVFLPPRTLLFDKFGVDVAQYCSGIESIALFSGLYALVGLLDWPRLDHRRYFAAFLPALVLLFACNILRVYLLILAGYEVNQQLAFSLFHTYAGMVFFILYSAAFWAVAYRWMLKVAHKT